MVTVSTLISCCERLGDWRRALELWDWMGARGGGGGGLAPDTYCYNTMITCMESSGQPERALQVFAALEESMVRAGGAPAGCLLWVARLQLQHARVACARALPSMRAPPSSAALLLRKVAANITLCCAAPLAPLLWCSLRA